MLQGEQVRLGVRSIRFVVFFYDDNIIYFRHSTATKSFHDARQLASVRRIGKGTKVVCGKESILSSHSNLSLLFSLYIHAIAQIR